MIRWLRALFAREVYPEPVIGHMWRNGHNGNLMKVSSIEVGDTGYVTIYVVRYHRSFYPSDDMVWGIPIVYAAGHGHQEAYKRFNRRLQDERRQLINKET